MDLSVVIVSYNVRDQLGQCLSSVEESGRALRQEIFVVDNASRDASTEMVRERFPHVRLISNRHNLGFARAVNQALRVSQGRYVLLLNPDTIVLDQCLPRMVEFMDQRPECGAATCRMWLDEKREWSVSNFLTTHPWREVLLSTRVVGRALTSRSVLEQHWRQCWQLWQTQEPCRVEGIMGAFFLVRRMVLEQVGELDERFFMYYEDADWSRRIRQAGWDLFLHPGVGLVHHSGQSSRGLRDFLGAVGRQSQRHYLRKHFGWLRAVLVRSLIVLDASLCRLLQAAGLLQGGAPGPIRPGAVLDLRDAPPCLSWTGAPEATRYLVEVGIEPLFFGGVARFVPAPEALLPVADFAKPGFQRVYWRAIPFRGDEPLTRGVCGDSGARRASGWRGLGD